MRRWIYIPNGGGGHVAQEIILLNGDYVWISPVMTGDANNMFVMGTRHAAACALVTGIPTEVQLDPSISNTQGFRTNEGHIWWGGSTQPANEYIVAVPSLSSVESHASIAAMQQTDRYPFSTTPKYNFYYDSTAVLVSGHFETQFARIDTTGPTRATVTSQFGAQYPLIASANTGKVYFVAINALSQECVWQIDIAAWTTPTVILANVTATGFGGASGNSRGVYSDFDHCCYWAPNGNGDIYKYDPNANTITRFVHPVSQPYLGITVNPSTGYLYSIGGSTVPSPILKIDPTTGTVVSTTTITPAGIGGTVAARDLMYNPLDNLLYVLYTNNSGQACLKSIGLP